MNLFTFEVYFNYFPDQELVNELLKDDVIGRMNGSAYVSLLNSSSYEASQHVTVPKDLVG